MKSLATIEPAVDPAPSAADYWESRARKFAADDRGLAAVCSYGMPRLYNEAIELCQRRALAPWLTSPRVGAALDVGCGIGRWSLRLAACGLDVFGLDISPFMVERARARARDARLRCQFIVGTVTDAKLPRRFDLILSVTVLQHIIDPGDAARALANLASHLRPGGEMVLLEAAPSRMRGRCDTAVFRARTLDWYRDALRTAGLRLVAVHGVDPVPLKLLLLPFYRKLPRPLALAAITLVTLLSLPLDLMLGRLLAAWSWHKVLVVRHAEDHHRAS